jgi:hypothetical protein
MARKRIIARNPLSPRETITPEALRPQQPTDGINLETRKQADNETREQPHQGQTSKPEPRRYATYLHPETIKRIKHYSIEEGMSDYEVVQAAMDEYFKDR